MMMPVTRLTVFTVSAWIIASLLAFAAGGVGAAVPDQPVVIAVGDRQCLCDLPIIMADRLGLFRLEGVATEVITFPTDTAAHEALLSHRAHAASGASAAAADPELAAVHRTSRASSVILITGPPEATAHDQASRDTPIQIGVHAQRSATEALVTAGVFSALPADASRVDLVFFDDVATLSEALFRDHIDMAAVTEPHATALVRRRAAHVLERRKIQPDDVPDPLDAHVLYAHRDWIDAHPETVQALQRAVDAAIDWMRQMAIDELLMWLPSTMRADYDDALLIEAMQEILPGFSLESGEDRDPIESIASDQDKIIRIFLAANGSSVLQLLSDDEAARWIDAFAVVPSIRLVNTADEADALINVQMSPIGDVLVIAAQFGSTGPLEADRMPLLVTLTVPLHDPAALNRAVRRLPQILVSWLDMGSDAWWDVVPYSNNDRP